MICIYEDEDYAKLFPLVDLKPVFDLRCGRRTLLDKIRRLYPREKLILWVRESLADVVAEQHPDCKVNITIESPCLFLSGRAILNKMIGVKGPEALFLTNDEVIGFRLDHATGLKPGSGPFEIDLPKEQVNAKVVEYPWDLVNFTRDELKKELRGGKLEGGLSRDAKVVGRRNRLRLGKGGHVWPGVVLSTETGSILVDCNAQVRPGSFIEGPCYIGPGTIIDGAKIRPGCSFGPECRIGGEVEATVFQGYSNKHHDGFIGHSFVGEWVNLGAFTTSSDLKNAYQPVKVQVGARQVDTGLLKVGCFFGDHVKTAIGSLFNTGAVVGTFANWFEPGLSPKYIKRFSWGKDHKWQLKDALTVARQVMAQRNVKMSRAYERLLDRVYSRI